MFQSLLLCAAFCLPGDVACDEVVFPGAIVTECVACVTLPDGRRIQVPVLNGYLPEIIERPGRRVLDYSQRIPYPGGAVTYVRQQGREPPKPAVRVPLVQLAPPLMRRPSEIKDVPRITISPSYKG